MRRREGVADFQKVTANIYAANTIQGVKNNYKDETIYLLKEFNSLLIVLEIYFRPINVIQSTKSLNLFTFAAAISNLHELLLFH